MIWLFFLVGVWIIICFLGAISPDDSSRILTSYAENEEDRK